MKKILFLLTFLVVAAAANAQVPTAQYPAFSLARLTVGARAEFNYWEAQDEKALPSFRPHEIGLGAVGSYAVVPNFSLTGRAIYYVDSKVFGYAVGVNVLVFDGRKYAESR